MNTRRLHKFIWLGLALLFALALLCVPAFALAAIPIKELLKRTFSQTCRSHTLTSNEDE